MKAPEVFCLAPGDLVRVRIHKNGYWTGIKAGRFLGIAKNGRIKVRLNKRTRLFDVRNVEKWVQHG